MALVNKPRGHWSKIYEPSDVVLATLGKLIEKHKKGQFLDQTSGQLVNLTDQCVREEHLFDSKSHRTRKQWLRRQTNAPKNDVILSLSNKVDVSSSVSRPYFVLESVLCDDKTLSYRSEGPQYLSQHLQRVLPTSEAKYAAENKGEVRSDSVLEFVVPRFSIILKPGKMSNLNEDVASPVSPSAKAPPAYVSEVMVGARISGKIQRGQEPEEAVPSETVTKKDKKGSTAALVQIRSFTWEVKSLAGQAILPSSDKLTSRSLVDIFNEVDDWTSQVCSDPSTWQILWVRTEPVSALADSMTIRTSPGRIFCARATLSPEDIDSFVNQDLSRDFVISTYRLSSSSLLKQRACLNFEFPSSKNPQEECVEVSNKLCRSFSGRKPFTCLIGQRGYSCAVTCLNGHVSVPVTIVSLAKSNPQLYSQVAWKRCERCIDEKACFLYSCNVCKDHGIICGFCGLGGLAYCPLKHALQITRDATTFFINCERCKTQGRTVTLECPVGSHYKETLCSLCVGNMFMPQIQTTLEPSPFEHCLGICCKVILNGASEIEANNFALIELFKCLNISDSQISRVLSVKLFPPPSPNASFEVDFILHRGTNDAYSVYKRVVDLTFICADKWKGYVVEIVETISVNVANAEKPEDLTELSNWMTFLEEGK